MAATFFLDGGKCWDWREACNLLFTIYYLLFCEVLPFDKLMVNSALGTDSELFGLKNAISFNMAVGFSDVIFDFSSFLL